MFEQGNVRVRKRKGALGEPASLSSVWGALRSFETVEETAANEERALLVQSLFCSDSGRRNSRDERAFSATLRTFGYGMMRIAASDSKISGAAESSEIHESRRSWHDCVISDH